MSKPDEKAEGKVKRNELTVVAEDTNWRTYVAKETQAESEFFENWGFLTKAGLGKRPLHSNSNLPFCRWAENRHQY